MNILDNFIAWIHRRSMAFLGLHSDMDPKVVVHAAPKSDDREIIPFARNDVPYLGEDHEELVKKAELFYESDDLRYKWLMSVSRLRTTQTGWILDRSNKQKPSPKWGLTACAF